MRPLRNFRKHTVRGNQSLLSTMHPNFENTAPFALKTFIHGCPPHGGLFLVQISHESYLFLLNFLVQICPGRYIQVSRVTSCTSVPEDDSPSPAVALYVKRTSFPCPLLAPCFRSVPRSPCVAVALLLLVLDDSISPWSRVDASRVGVCRAKRLSAPTWIALSSSVRHETRRMGR